MATRIPGIQYEVSSHFTRIGCCCLLKWYEKRQINLKLIRFQSCSYANDVATTHVVYSHCTTVVLYSCIVSVTTKTIKVLTYIGMNHTKTQKLLRPIKDFGGGIFTTSTIYCTAVQAQK